jgi:MFS transporter, OFA family, oxalate/formate antiporter
MKQSSFSKPFLNPKKWPFFYGWWIIVMGTFGVLMSVPGQTIGVSTFTDSLIEVLSLSRDQLSLAYMFGTVISSLMLTRAGRFYDRVGIRFVATVASLMLGLALVYLSFVDILANAFSNAAGLPKIYVAFAAILIGFMAIRFFGQGVITLVSRTMMMKWFDQRRGFAMGFSNVLVALSFSSAPLFFEALIQEYDWRGAWRLMSLVLFFVFPIVIFLFFRDDPKDFGLSPDGSFSGFKNKLKKKLFVVKKDFTLKEARQTYTFWVFTGFLAMHGFYITGFTFHIVSIFEEAGLSRVDAVSIFQPAAVVAVIVTLIFSPLSDRMRLKYLSMVLASGYLTAIIGMAFLKPDGPAYYILIVGTGMIMGLSGVVGAVCWPRFFGKMHLGAIGGNVMTFIVFGSAFGPVLFSASLTYFGSYNFAVWCCFIAFLLLLFAAIWANNPQDKVIDN